MVENLNVKSLQIDKLYNDLPQDEIISLSDNRIELIIELDQMALNMASSHFYRINYY